MTDGEAAVELAGTDPCVFSVRKVDSIIPSVSCFMFHSIS